MKRLGVLCVFGTRPEAIKFLAVIRALQQRDEFEPVICVTSQHRRMIDQVLDTFGISPDFDLDLMTPNQDLFDLTSRVLTGLRPVLSKVKPDWLLVQGDTTTTLAAAMAGYFSHTAIGYIEAGLRTYNKYAPFPEELNRRATSVFADLHFAPTQFAKKNLLSEKIPAEKIRVTGNPGIDALLLVRTQIETHSQLRTDLEQRFSFLDPGKRLILITAHRRESFGSSFLDICLALREIAEQRPDLQIVYPVHLNPNVREPVEKILGKIQTERLLECQSIPGLKNVFLIEPVDYIAFVYLMIRAYLIVTDSGGVQEEAPTLGKPILVMRDVTERPEALETPCVKLVGTSKQSILANVLNMLDSPTDYQAMAQPSFVFGNGHAAEQILDALKEIAQV